MRGQERRYKGHSIYNKFGVRQELEKGKKESCEARMGQLKGYAA